VGVNPVVNTKEESKGMARRRKMYAKRRDMANTDTNETKTGNINTLDIIYMS